MSDKVYLVTVKVMLVWLICSIAASTLSGCSFKVESEYFGKTGKRDVVYSPTMDDGDQQYVQKVGKRY